MNESEYLQSRIKYLEKIISTDGLPKKLKINQQTALANYKKEYAEIQKNLR